MAQYEITYSCGHTATTALYGPQAKRDRHIAWAEKSGMCPDCKKAAGALSCEKLEEEYDLPELKGSEKQIAWARKIRHKQVVKIDECIERYRYLAQRKGLVERFEADADNAVQKVYAKEEASWWIDQGQADPYDVLNKMGANLP